MRLSILISSLIIANAIDPIAYESYSGILVMLAGIIFGILDFAELHIAAYKK